jgi:Domain of unknown function (DUF4365)
MHRLPSAQVSALGVTHTQLAVVSELGWLFREQPTEDYGSDAQVELVEGNVVSGMLLGFQIKSGVSWFHEPGPGGWWYRPDAKHVQYWLSHSLPIVVVLFHPDTVRCHWQLVSRDTLVDTSAGGYKLFVPDAQVLEESARGPLRKVAARDPTVANGATCSRGPRERRLEGQPSRATVGGNRAPGSAAPQIRYALSQLRSRNGHHDFEHLCREIARLRITPNILPATGPVSSGGDQGRDFETFHTYVQEHMLDSSLAGDGSPKIVFACTLQHQNLPAKIMNDLRAISNGGRVDRVYFFCEQDVPVARRHKLCRQAREGYGTEIEIIDGYALSELLASSDCRWIADRYLGLNL